jgi:transcriptional regulator with XRE-family HTH domain
MNRVLVIGCKLQKNDDFKRAFAVAYFQQVLFNSFNFIKNVYNCNMSDDAVLKRIKIIVKEHGGQLALANAINVDQGFISKVINKKQDISYYLIRKLCFQLKYSPEWLILGTGDKMIHKQDSAKLITEIQMLRTEVDILHARMRAFELQLQEIQQQAESSQQKAG